MNVLDLVNNPSASGKCRVFGLSFREGTLHDLPIQIVANIFEFAWIFLRLNFGDFRSALRESLTAC